MLSVTVHNLVKAYAETVAVDHVDLEVRSGELFFLLGPSGCGKTTLMRMIAGLLDPTSGAIRFGERDVTHVPTGQRNTAMVFQGYALWPHMTVAQNVAFGLDVRGISKPEREKRVQEALRAVRMAEYADRRPAQLSGGQQQRVALGRALVVQPDVMLMDEPLSNLDAKLRIEMRHEIKRICSESNVTAIYVTHDQEEALTMADRLAVMRDGKIRQIGSPQDVYAKPIDRFVAGFLGSTNFIPAIVRGNEGGKLRLETPIGDIVSAVFPADLPIGRDVTCSVRPEAMSLADAEHAENNIQVTFDRSVFLGNLVEYLFKTGDGTTIAVTQLQNGPLRGVAPDSACRIGFSSDQVVVLTD